MKILLIKPETLGIFSYTFLVEHEPLEMEYLYTVFTARGHEAVIYDRRYELTGLKKKLKQEKPDIVCITGYITQQDLMIRYCDVIKKYDPDIRIILGGSNVEINYKNYYGSKADYLYHLSGLENLLKLADHIEGRSDAPDIEDIPGVCYRKEGKWICNPKVVESPEDLPVPDRSFFLQE